MTLACHELLVLIVIITKPLKVGGGQLNGE